MSALLQHLATVKRNMSDADAALTLVLEPDSPYNTTIYDDGDGRIYYQVVTTTQQDETMTRIIDDNGEPLAFWVWRDVRSEMITFRHGHPTPTSTWLRRSVFPFKDSVTFTEPVSGKQYKWKGLSASQSPELYVETDKKNPVARFEKSHLQPVNGVQSGRNPGYLLLDRRGERIRDLAVISFLVLEKHRRLTEHSTVHHHRWRGQAG